MFLFYILFYVCYRILDEKTAPQGWESARYCRKLTVSPKPLPLPPPVCEQLRTFFASFPPIHPSTLQFLLKLHFVVRIIKPEQCNWLSNNSEILRKISEPDKTTEKAKKKCVFFSLCWNRRHELSTVCLSQSQVSKQGHVSPEQNFQFQPIATNLQVDVTLFGK